MFGIGLVDLLVNENKVQHLVLHLVNKGEGKVAIQGLKRILNLVLLSRKMLKNSISQALRFLNCMKAHIIISSLCYQTSLLMSLSKGRVCVELAISLEKYEWEVACFFLSK